MITKEKYQKLMDEKIRIERERNKLFGIAQKMLGIIREAGLEINLKELRGIKNQAGISLIPEEGEVNKINYGPFRNDF